MCLMKVDCDSICVLLCSCICVYFLAGMMSHSKPFSIHLDNIVPAIVSKPQAVQLLTTVSHPNTLRVFVQLHNSGEAL